MHQTAEDLDSRKRESTAALRNAIGNSIGLQVILIAVSVSLYKQLDVVAVSLVALAVYWAAVIGRALQLRDASKVTALDLHLLRWGYLWFYCVLVLFYRVYGAVH